MKKKTIQFAQSEKINIYSKGIIYFLDKQYNQAEGIFRKLSDYPPYNYLYAKILFNSGKYIDAILQISKGIKGDNEICQMVLNNDYRATVPLNDDYLKNREEFIEHLPALFQDFKYNQFLRRVYLNSKTFEVYIDSYVEFMCIRECCKNEIKFKYRFKMLGKLYNRLLNYKFAKKIYSEIKPKLYKCVKNV